MSAQTSPSQLRQSAAEPARGFAPATRASLFALTCALVSACMPTDRDVYCGQCKDDWTQECGQHCSILSPVSMAGSGGSSAEAGMGGTGMPDAGMGGTAGSDAPVGGGGDGGNGAAGSGGSAGGSGGCYAANDLTISPKDAECLIDNDYAVFVSRDGNDGAPGTMLDPAPSIAAGIAAAQGRRRRIIVCSGTYTEPLVINDVPLSGLALYGGFDCDVDGSWHPDGLGTEIAPASGVPLTIVDIQHELRIENMAFRSANLAAPAPAGQSSIAAIIQDSDGVTLKGVGLTAGRGAAGAEGTVTPFESCGDTWASVACLNGNHATGADPGTSRTYTCQGGALPEDERNTMGGSGGRPPDPNGIDGTPVYPGTPGGAGGVRVGISCAQGVSGAPGPNGTEGGGATVPGTLVSSQWRPASGSDGAEGRVGQGGGGGSATSSLGGGGGGAGGCGGAPGTGGGGGGASIALLSVDSKVVLLNSQLRPGEAGRGGPGAAGQPGQLGGNPGNATFGCSGGGGGRGGRGGAGGGGAGGISVGIMYRGEPPGATDSHFTPGTGGARGIGGDPGENDGLPGEYFELFEVQE